MSLSLQPEICLGRSLWQQQQHKLAHCGVIARIGKGHHTAGQREVLSVGGSNDPNLSAKSNPPKHIWMEI